MTAGVMLYGAPAVGKSSTAAALRTHGLLPYTPVKHGRGRTSGYRMVNAEELERIRAKPDDILWERHRYGSTYLWLQSELLSLSAIAPPIVESGQPDAVEAITRGVPGVVWTVVELWCPRSVAEQRIYKRGTGDEDERLTVYDATPQLSSPDLRIDTSTVSAAETAQQIMKVVRP